MDEIAIKPVSRDQLSRLVNLVLPSQLAAKPQQPVGGEPSEDLPPVFDETCLRDLFLPGDQEVNVWISNRGKTPGGL